MDCANAVCIVTGASSGLGKAVAGELLRRGARVAALDIVSMTLAAARELAPLAIRVNTIAPGLMDTPMLRGLAPAAVATHMSKLQFPSRPGAASEFAELACHIIENKYLNAATVRLDGGLRL
jgi:3-hydroxyacyl-CoA dehydrogenase / 3-hydroxy-2-methylbutyryl-CoA dehydrogenase